MPASLRSGDLIVLGLAAAATLLLSALSFVMAPAPSAAPVDGSSFAVHAGGARAAYLALKRAGYRVEPSFEAIARLRRAPSETVLVLASPVEPPTQQDLRALSDFVERGGILVAAGPSSARFLPDQPFRRGRTSPGAGSVSAASIVSPLSRGAGEVEMTPPAASLTPGSTYLPVYGDTSRPYVIAATIGQGRAIWWSGVGPLTNRGIMRAGHAELLINALGPPSDRVVLWDEHYHGYTRSFWSYVAGTPVPFAGVQLGLMGVAALLAFTRRRWPVRPEHVEARTSPLEFVEGMGALYQRAGVAAGAVTTVRLRTRRALAAACGVPSTIEDDDLARAAASRVSMAPDELRELLATSLQASRDVRLRPEQARAAVARLQRVAAALR